MPRINTYPPDVILQNEDLILGSDYKGTVNGIPIYETKSFSLNSLANYLSRYVYVNPNIYDLELIYTNLENIDAANARIDDTITTITTVQTNLQNQIATDLADLQSQTEQSITLLDTTLNSAISDVANTITTEVSNLNDRILQGETDLAADIVALGDTITTETQNLTTLINTETGLIADTVANLDNSITLQLGDLNTDIAGALQQAIDAGDLAVAAQASVDAEVIARTSAVGAVAGKIETIETQFVFSTEDGSIVGASGALAETITTTASTAAGAVATRVDILETEYVLDTNDGSILGLSENSVTNVALTTVTGAVATRVDTIETQFTITDGVVTGFSQAARDRIDTSISNATSAQFQTLDTIKTQFVFDDQTGNITAVSDVIQTSITDSISDATSAQFTKLDEVATQFVFDANNDITGVQGTVSSTIDSAKLEAISTAELAAQSKVDTFAAKIVTTDANGNITGLSDAVQTTVSDVIAQDGYAESSRVDTLEATVGDANGGLVASVSTAQSAINDINGNLTASYGVHVKAGNKIAGLKLLADGSTDSNFIAQADIFGVEMPNGTRVLTVDENGLFIDGSGTFTGDFNAGLVEIRSNNIRLKATASYGSTGNLEFFNAAGNEFANISSGSTTFGTDTYDSIRIQGTPTDPLSSVSLRAQALIMNPGDHTSFPVGTGSAQIGNFVEPWKSVGVSGTESVLLGNYNAGDVSAKNYVHLVNQGSLIYTAISSEGYVSISSAGDINMYTGSGGKVYINGAEVGTGTATDTTRSDEEIRDVIASFITAGNNVTVSHDDAGNTLTINSSYTDTNTQRSDEEIRDVIAGFIKAGTNVSVSHNDAANTFTITSTDTNTQRSDEEIRDVIASFATAGSYMSVSHDDAANTLTFALNTGTADTRYLRRDTSGSVNGTITATDFVVASDQRLKNNINTYIPSPININYRDYKLNSDDTRTRVGVIAQELEAEHPQFVVTNAETGMKAVSYVDLLMAKVAELEERIKQLENGGS